VKETEIIATLGPSSFVEGIIRQMLEAGAGKFRLNLAHDSVKYSRNFLGEVVILSRKIAHDLGRTVEIMADIPGHKIRLGEFVSREVRLGDPVELVLKDPKDGQIPFPHKKYLLSMKVGQMIILGDGIPRLQVVKVGSGLVMCEVVLAGLLEPKKGLTVRGFQIASLGLPPFTKADDLALKFAIGIEAEKVVMSYGTSAKQLSLFTRRYRSLGGKGDVYFKCELKEAVSDLDAIVEGSDGGFVGRGDLSLSMPSELVPNEVAKVVSAYRAKGKPCIVGTQLFSSMRKHPFCTMAEADGVYFNVAAGATDLMVSDETATGDFPVDVVKIMRRLIDAAKKSGLRLVRD
jgi:pyruvate kinase